MIDITLIKSFLGWCIVLNAGLLILSTLSLTAFGNAARQLHARMFQLDEYQVKAQYFQYLANYKIVLLFFNVVPYLALTFMGF